MLCVVELSECNVLELLFGLMCVYWVIGCMDEVIEMFEEVFEFLDVFYFYLIECYMMFLFEECDGLVVVELFL